MEAFVYNAAKPRESLESFNDRIKAYCLDNPVVGIEATCMGPTMMVSLTHADDVEVPVGNTVLAHFHYANGLDDQLEEHIGEVVDTLVEEDTPDDARVPWQAQLITRRDLPNEGWLMVLCVTGSVDEASDGYEDN